MLNHLLILLSTSKHIEGRETNSQWTLVGVKRQKVRKESNASA